MDKRDVLERREEGPDSIGSLSALAHRRIEKTHRSFDRVSGAKILTIHVHLFTTELSEQLAFEIHCHDDFSSRSTRRSAYRKNVMFRSNVGK